MNKNFFFWLVLWVIHSAFKETALKKFFNLLFCLIPCLNQLLAIFVKPFVLVRSLLKVWKNSEAWSITDSVSCPITLILSKRVTKNYILNVNNQSMTLYRSSHDINIRFESIFYLGYSKGSRMSLTSFLILSLLDLRDSLQEAICSFMIAWFILFQKFLKLLQLARLDCS